MVDIKAKIRNLMNVKELTIYALAQKTDISQVTIANWFNKKNSQPTIDALAKVCEVFGITLAELFCDVTDRMYPVSGELRELFMDWQRLDKEQKVAVKTVVKSYLKN